MMLLNTLINRIIDSAQDVIAAIEAGEALPNLALRRSARLPVVAAIHAAIGRPILLLTDRTDHALTLADELALWTPQAHRMFFPEPNPLFYEQAPWGPSTRRDRLAVLTQLARFHIPGVGTRVEAPLIIAPARAIMARTLPRREFLKATHELKIGQTISPDALARELVTLGFEAVNTVTNTGQFARRGGILDLWPQAENQPTRIEFFGDDIDTLRRFDPATQRTVGVQERVLISPAREYLLPPSLLEADPRSPGSPEPLPSPPATDTPSAERQDLPNSSPAADNSSPAADTSLLAADPRSAASPLTPEDISEFHLPLLHPSPASLLEYLPRDGLVLIDNWDLLQNAINDIEEKALSLRSDYIAEDRLPADFPLPYVTWTEIQDSLSSRQTIELGPATAAAKPSLAEKFSAGPRFGGRLKPLMDHLSRLDAQGETFTVVSRQAARLAELWRERFPHPNVLSPEPQFIEGSLAEGWVFTPSQPPQAPKLHLLTDGEIFGWRRPEPRRRYRGPVEPPESAYADLQVGDWVVHVDFGIGRFLGLVNRLVDGVEREYLAVEYAQGDQLFVPVHQADRLSRYVGPDSRVPTPSRLGGVEWRNAKQRVKEAVEEVAEDLLDLYAERQVVSGYAFSQDTSWQGELEASFPYIETEDQLRVLAEVKQDMESPRPMDRLICGDVGYGKTEIALRAAFKAVMDGKQVALLVPTTVLAQQHYHTFRERLAPFPVEVEMLSRFRTPQQQREIIFRLAMGGLDIVIGTHRLLQEDIEFKDLGLLIIDEEQRFGVTHKEFLKRKRTEVDVLTLTATPIPRTLYMALTGVRDISTIDTPPEERLPIITHVGPYSKRLIRQAILRELDRGGQVFFVHNRVQTIHGMRNHLEHLVPEARITIAHGQMPEANLSERMEQFTAGEVDVLLSTSIIESGLDIPNANTLIVDRADTFGLAQLYQLRGRVGRGAQRAYAYFFKHRRKSPTLEGGQRLETLAENTQLGAGFSIAMRDLEIRGAGDILGTRQHGHIAAVGFHLYTRLLADSVAHLRSDRGLPAEPFGPAQEISRQLINVDLPLDIGIPADYVPDKNMRLRLYRRIAALREVDEIEALAEEFRDRFGPLPDQVDGLLYQLKVKLMAEQAGLSGVSAENQQIALRFRGGEPPPELPNLGAHVRVGRTALWFPYSQHADWQVILIDLLHKLSAHKHELDERVKLTK